MELKDKIIIGLLSILVVMGGISFIGGGKSFGSYDESYTNFTKLKATDAFISEGTASISGQATLATASATALTVSGQTFLNGGLLMDTNKFTVADATGNTLIAGTLGVTGTTTLATSTATSLTVSAAVGSSTLAIGGTVGGKLCIWNGTNYTIELYTANSTSTVIATSTTCN